MVARVEKISEICVVISDEMCAAGCRTGPYFMAVDEADFPLGGGKRHEDDGHGVAKLS